MVMAGTMADVLGEFVNILVSGITDLGSGIATGVASMAKDLFITEGTGGALSLSTFGGIVAIFAGLALAVGITTKVFPWVRTLGN